MSRIGRKPVAVPANVKVSVADSTIHVEGPKGKLSFTYRERDRRHATTRPASRSSSTRSDDERAEPGPARPDPEPDRQHGRRASPTGYTKKLEIVGVGYQAQLKKANTVALQVGYANQVVLEAPRASSVVVPDPTHITITRRRQAGGRPVRRRGPQGPPPRAVQGQGHPLRGRGRPPQGRQGVRREVNRATRLAA